MAHHSCRLPVILIALCLMGEIRSKIIDLSHVHDSTTLMSNPATPKFNRTTLEKGSDHYGMYVESGWYSSSEHGGTHMDAPVHFNEGGMTLDEIPIEYTVLEGVMIDCAEHANENREYGVTLDRIQRWEVDHGRIPDNAAILVNFNWSARFHNETDYKGTNDFTNFLSYSYPYITEQAAMWLLEHRQPRLVGTDTMTPDPFHVDGALAPVYPIHQFYLRENRLIIENLRDLWQLPARGFRFHATPVAYKGNTGAQIRAFAMTYEEGGNHAPNMAALHWTAFCLSIVWTFLYTVE